MKKKKSLKFKMRLTINISKISKKDKEGEIDAEATFSSSFLLTSQYF